MNINSNPLQVHLNIPRETAPISMSKTIFSSAHTSPKRIFNTAAVMAAVITEAAVSTAAVTAAAVAAVDTDKSINITSLCHSEKRSDEESFKDSSLRSE